jgi:DNA-binding NtrC family response regulator
MSLLLALPACRSLMAKLDGSRARILSAQNVRRARRLLEEDPTIEVVITGLSFDDGNWCDVVKYVVDRGHRAEVIVTSPVATQTLWSEIIWRGAYDLLIEPYGAEEVLRAVEGAIREARRTSVWKIRTNAA